MTYGIKVYNSSTGSTLLDSDLQTQMQPPYDPIALSATGNFTKQDNEIIVYGRGSTNGTPLLNKPFGSNIITASGAIDCNRLSIREVDSDSPPSSNDYGITIYDAGGTSTQTYSDSYGRSFTIKEVIPNSTIVGGATIYSASTTDIYVGTSGSPTWGSTFRYNQFEFSTNYIKFVNYFNFLGTTNLPNYSPIIIIELRS